MRVSNLQHVFCDNIPEVLEEGKLYISEKYEIAIHLCACGCGIKTVTPLDKDGWRMTNIDGKITLRPSIGNFMGENPFHAHYYITNSNIEWLT